MTIANNNASTLSSAAHQAEETMMRALGRVKTRAAQYGQKAADAVDARREAAASTLESAASGIRSTADNATQAAETLKATALYVREHEAQDMLSDIKGFLKAHPTPALLGAVVVGFVVGRAVRN